MGGCELGGERRGLSQSFKHIFLTTVDINCHRSPTPPPEMDSDYTLNNNNNNTILFSIHDFHLLVMIPHFVILWPKQTQRFLSV